MINTTVFPARLPALVALSVGAVLALAGCSSSGSASTAAQSTPTTSASAGATSTAATPAPATLTNVSIALDWTPNTDHLGIYVAQELGYFKAAGLKVKIIPYGSTAPADLVSSGAADFGIAGEPDVEAGRPAGQDIKAVYGIVQHETGALVTLPNKGINSPKDLDGKVFGGFGLPLYSDIARTIIKNAGGKGDLKEVTLDTAAYDALTAGKIDFTESIATWENIQQELIGKPYKSFSYQDYGVPDEQTLVIISSDKYLAANPDTTKKFIQAVQKGFEYSIAHPDQAADLLIKAAPDVLSTQSALVHKSAEVLATQGYLQAKGQIVGASIPELWTKFGAYLIENGLVKDKNGKVITTAPDWSTFYTNEYLAQ